MLELEHHVDLGTCGIGEQLRVLDGDAGHLADGEELSVPAGEHGLVHLVHELVDPRAVDERTESVPVARIESTVGQFGILRDEVDDVHPEPVHAPVEPPPHHRVDGLTDLGVLPVQIRLLLREHVQVVLARLLVELPRRARERRAPVGGFRARIARVHPVTWAAPPVPVSFAGCRGSNATRRTTDARRRCG